ncbi:MAG: AI-2E family transporter [SAR202 cluster bacterium]|nr:AI-2E family transporter [SAR202 cluster bacterium]
MASPPAADEQARSYWLRYRQRGLLVVVLGALAVAFFVARGALLPFIAAIILAQLLFPTVRALENRIPWRSRWPEVSRIAAILIIYVAAGGLLAGLLLLTVPTLFRESRDFIDTTPDLYEAARETIEDWGQEYADRVPPEVREKIESSAADFGDTLISAAQSLALKTIAGVSNAITVVIGVAMVPFLLFYLLKDREDALGSFYGMMSPANRQHAQNVVAIVNDVVGAYIRAQLFSASIVGVFVFLGLLILGIQFSALLGLVAGLFVLVPIIGTVLGAIPGILVVLATSREDLIWVVLVYVVVQLVESTLISPRVQGKAVNIHPVLIMAILVVASEVAGLWGVVIGVPLTAAGRDVFNYFYNKWESPSKDNPVQISEPVSEPGESALDAVQQDAITQEQTQQEACKCE